MRATGVQGATRLRADTHVRDAAEFLATLVFLFVVITNIVYREAFNDRSKLTGVTDKNTLETIGYITNLGAAAQMMIAATFGCVAAFSAAAFRCAA